MKRHDSLDRIQRQSYDAIIVGGGITGAGIALDMAARGLRVVLFEKDDFAYGTSSRSTKLIHGGLRYLKQLEFGLVREVGRERAVLHQLAAHLVRPQKMLMPLYEKRGMGSRLTSFGLMVYDFLAGVKRDERRVMLSRNRALKAEPLLVASDIKGGAMYVEYRTDDARLTIEVIKTAADHGATVLNYCEVTDFVFTNKKITGVHVRDKLGASYTVSSEVVINATGPWVDMLRDKDQSKKGKRLQLTKGVHLVLPWDKLPLQQSIYFNTTDGRMIFGIPRGDCTYIGTTDTPYHGVPDEVKTHPDDVTYLLKGTNEAFSIPPLKPSDVISSWVGLRPLIYEEGKSAGELSRKDEIFQSKSGLYSIAGGKLTGYRKMAERITDLIIRNKFPGLRHEQCSTNVIALTSTPLPHTKAVGKFEAAIAQRLYPLGLATEAVNLVSLYGTQCYEILNLMTDDHADNEINLALAELQFGIDKEFVLKATDYLVRRSARMYFGGPSLQKVIEPVLTKMTALFEWDKARLAEERAEINRLLSEQVPTAQ